MGNRIELVPGQRYWRLTAIRRVDHKKGHTQWLFLCECGREVIRAASSVNRGNTKSCGCLHSETAEATCKSRATHGMSKSRTYRIWEAMHRRCTYPSQQNYPRYGGKGIKVCERWDSFENFLADMGERPDGGSLDRYPDRNGNYEPNNCRWATTRQQEHNKDGSIWVEHDGRRLHVSEWARITGFQSATIASRIRKGWSAERALTTKINGRQGQRP